MIRQLLPSGVRKRVRNLIKHSFHFKEQNEFMQDFLAARQSNEKHIPKINLQKKHIQNLKVLTDRLELLQNMSKGVVTAEIGVNAGNFSAKILEITKPSKLHLIDAWGNPERYHDGLKLEVHEKFKEAIQKGKVEIHVGYSTVVLEKIPDHYFDWVYLDTDHSYSVTAAELALLKDKVKVGGIIAGHDYIIGNWPGDVRYGVIEAVHEFCLNENWELVFITINTPEMPSFAIRQIR